MLANLLNSPRSDVDWSIWSFSNQQAVIEIQRAIVGKGGPSLPQYQLDPIAAADGRRQFLEWNAQSHIDFNAELGLSGVDLQSVDLDQENQRQAWVFLNYQELYTACSKLGIGP